MITNDSRIADLAAELAARRGSIRIGSKNHGTVFVCAVDMPGGSTLISNVSLAVALNGVLMFMRVPAFESMERVEADPNGAKVGPVPTEGTRTGYVLTGHCAACGFGENDSEHFYPEHPCPKCGVAGKVCRFPPHHDQDHDYTEDVQELSQEVGSGG